MVTHTSNPSAGEAETEAPQGLACLPVYHNQGDTSTFLKPGMAPHTFSSSTQEAETETQVDLLS